jgi:hypothetical protein
MYRSLLDLKFVYRRCLCRKIRTVPLMVHLRYMKSFISRDRIMIQSTLPRKFSKLKNVKSVPQTNTGDQVD